MRAAFIVAAGLSVALASATPAQAQSAGLALHFDGTTDLVRLPATATMMAPTWGTTKTISLWVNPTGTPSCTAADPATCDVIFGDRPRTFGISRGVLGGQDRIWIWNYDGTLDRVGVEYTPGVWIQITLVHGGGMLSAYKNGLFVGSVASGSTPPNSSQVLYFGGIINNAARNWTFEGDIDEVQIWNVARSATEILASMNGPLTGSEIGLAAYYRMTNGSGTSLTDDSGHGWTGTLLDGASDVPGNGPITWIPSGAFGGGPITPNTPPTANPQSLGTNEDTAVGITLTGADADNDPITFRVTVQPAHGTLTGTAPLLTYTPAANYFGPDSFAFVTNDTRVDSNPATVSLNVASVNDPPVAANDSANAAMDTTIAIQVLANDSDVDNGLLTVSAVTAPHHGVVVNDVAYVSYTPANGYIGTDTFGYTVSDGQGGFATATVTVNVTETGADPGLALRFDGVSDFVSLAKTIQMLAPGWESRKTVSLWVKPEGIPTCTSQIPAACDSIFGDRPRWWGIARGVINGFDRIWVWNSSNGAYHSVGVPYTTGQWVHIALVHNDGILSAYKNGALVGSIASGPTQQPNVASAQPVLHLGGVINNASRNWTFQGQIDEVQIWNKARLPSEIQLDLSGPLSGSEPYLAAYYRMSDGAGSLLTDDSGHGWTGTLADGAIDVPADGVILWVPSGAFTVTP